jgi:hypothetical protein
MRVGNLRSIPKYFVISLIAVMLPIHCIVHCVTHDTSAAPKSPYVCTMQQRPSQSPTQIHQHAYQPSAIHEVRYVEYENVISTVYTRTARATRVVKNSRNDQPDPPPPRCHSSSLYSL